MIKMDIRGLKDKQIINQFGLKSEFGRIFSFIDFGNVNYWFEEDQYDHNGDHIDANNKLVIDLKGLADFANAFSEKSRFYYGIDRNKKKSVGFIRNVKDHFVNVISKDIQKIKHYLAADELQFNKRPVNYDTEGDYVFIPKCNFDVEISIDAIRLADKYDTFCLFSSDSDFSALVHYLKKKGKKFILVKGGFAQFDLKKLADKTINAQDIKKYITYLKQKSSR